ncbi:hypothetical protein XELAEV_18014770mg [Xenopus laevis]|uniref:Uncharacterized protein n=1 Tax=Xenopus laevis TaxID=8355 RepID=A0A974DH82_XENLA|nr:hypothetical protein XELAEV_18014770mg [Xenopus laevis]
MFPRFVWYWFIARAPSGIQDTVRLLWQVENELPDDGEGPSMIFLHGLPDGCPCVYASLPAQSPKKEKMVVINPSAVYLWALLEKNLSDARAAELCNPPSEDEESVGVTGSIDRVDYPEGSRVPTGELPSEPEGPVESLPRESTGLIESTDRGDCLTEEVPAAELPCEPESPVVLLLEESPPITVIPLSPVDKGDAGDVVALPQEESGPSANVSPCFEMDLSTTLLTTELCALNMENSPAIEVACVNIMPECASAESDPPGGVSEEVAAVEFCTAPCSPSLPCSVGVKLVSARKRQRRRARPNRGGVSRVMARRPSLEDNTAAILYLASTLLELADAKKQMVEPVAEPGAWGMMVPVCGLCDLEAPNALEDPGGACLQCGSQLWMGPFHRADQLPLVGKTEDEVSKSHVPIPHSEACCNEECAFPSEVASIEGEALETEDAVSEVTPSGWTVDAGAAPVPEKPESGGEIMASLTPMPSVATVPVAPGGVADSEILSEPIADFSLQAVAVFPEVETLQPEVMLELVESDNSQERRKALRMKREDTSVLGPKESLSTSENSGPWVDLTLTTYTALITPTCAPVVTHDIDWRKFSFGRIASDPSDEDEDSKSVSENTAQIRCKCQRSVVSEPIQSSNPKVMVHVTPSEPGESTHVSELYHLEWGKISLAGEKDWVTNIPKPKVDPTTATAPGWEEYEEESPELDDQPAPKEFMSRSFIAPPKIGPEEEKNFWVLPGRADPNISRSVSRVQRVINFRVYRKWGYFMPYAPLWVYERVAASYEDWIIGQILRKEKMHHSCLTNPNEVWRKQDWEYLRSIEREWWYGRTILKNTVKSSGKYNPTKYFSLEPHPKYYIPYEDTKARFLHMI